MDEKLQQQYRSTLETIARSKPVNVYDENLMYALGAAADLSQPLRVIRGFVIGGNQYRYGEQVEFTEAERGAVLRHFKAGELIGEAEYQVMEAWPKLKERRPKLEEAHRIATNAEAAAAKEARNVERLKSELEAAQAEQAWKEQEAAAAVSAFAALLN